MASKKSNWQENYAGLILGAIIVIILGLLVANFITNKNEQIGNGESTSEIEESMESSKYTVEEGDSLSKIAEKVYGDLESWPVIARANNVTNPNLIFVGVQLEIPSEQLASEMRTKMTQTSYEVQSGDTIFIISEKMYGDGSKWSVIARANNVGSLPNGNPLIFAGSTLSIPR